jgi:hypothetical protein
LIGEFHAYSNALICPNQTRRGGDKIDIDILLKLPPIIPAFRLCCEFVFDPLLAPGKLRLLFDQLLNISKPSVDFRFLF